MHVPDGRDTNRIADQAPGPALPALPETDALLSELGALYPLMAFAGNMGEPPPADAWEAPSGSSTEERRSEMDERILAGLLWQ